MSAPMTPERLAEIRAWLAWEYRASLGERGEQIAAELLAEVDRLRRLLGSHTDGHRCTCTMTDPGVYHGDNMHPPEWEPDPWCPTHPDVDVILAEVDRLNQLLAAVSDLAQPKSWKCDSWSVDGRTLWRILHPPREPAPREPKPLDTGNWTPEQIWSDEIQPGQLGEASVAAMARKSEAKRTKETP